MNNVKSSNEPAVYETLRPRVGAKYAIRHRSMGAFMGYCTQSNPGWAAFRVLDGNAELAGIDINPGEEVELTTDFYVAKEIEPPWNHQRT